MSPDSPEQKADESAAEATRILSDVPTLLLADAAAAHSKWSVGECIEDRYHVVDVRGGHGISGMGIVYVLDDGQRRLAAKSFQRQFATDLSLIERFLREARAWMLTGRHPNIVDAHFVDIIEAVPYLFMEYVESDSDGRLSLADHLTRGPLPIGAALRYAIQFCDGMVHATSVVPGLVHRDLKPENLLITPDRVLKITDFGLVRCHISDIAGESPCHGGIPAESLTSMGAVFGTPAYMAPEQFASPGAVTMAADIYAFGCCFYEALNGRPPFQAHGSTPVERLAVLREHHEYEKPKPLNECLPVCPPDLDNVIMKCLEKNPADRWRDFREIRDRLAAIFRDSFGETLSSPHVAIPSEEAHQEQRESLQLLDGYERAIRFRHLRENQDASPYAFHLALASYFHCHGQPREEMRQLMKARHARRDQAGYEVVRRLADLLVAEGVFEKAWRLIEDFLSAYPKGLDHVLEPYVRVLAAQGRSQEAEALLDELPVTLRTGILRGELLHAQGRWIELAGLLTGLVARVLENVNKKLAMIEPGDVVGWGRAGDRELLREVLSRLHPEEDISALDHVEDAVWPDLTGNPDFSADMAWLSEGLGRLGELEGYVPESERLYSAPLARMLGYPERLKHHMERDEYWFWRTENGNGERHDEDRV